MPARTATEWPPWNRLVSLPLLRHVLGFCLFELAYLAAYHFGMTFSPTAAAPFWFPDSVLLCALLCTRRSWWWLLLLGTLPIRMFVAVHPDTPLLFLATVFANDCIKAMLAAWLLQRFLDDPIRFNSMRDFGVYFLFVVILVPMLSAFGGAGSRVLLGHSYWSSFEQWFIGDAMASIIVTPVLFYWVLRPPNPRTFSAPRMLEAAVLLLGLLVSLQLAFESAAGAGDFAEARYYVPVLFIVWAAIRFRMFGATGAVALLTLFAVDAAFGGSGSFASLSSGEMSSRLQHFLLLRAPPLYLAAVLIEQTVRVGNSLRESEQRYRDVVESQSGFVCRLLYDTSLTFVNTAYCRLVGKPREQLLGMKLLDLLPPIARREAGDAIARAIAHAEASSWECEVAHPDGSRGWQHWVCHAIDSEGEDARELQVVGQDITDRKRAEESGRQLAHATRFAAVGELTAMVAHEINQPLTAILSNAEAGELLMKSDKPPLDDIREILADIRKDDLRADAAIRGIRSLLQRREFQPRPMQVNEMVAHVLRLIAGDALHRRVTVRRELAGDLPTVVCDNSLIEQVLVILIVNAMDAMKDTAESSRALTIATRRAARGPRRIIGARSRPRDSREKHAAALRFLLHDEGGRHGAGPLHCAFDDRRARWAHLGGEHAPDGGAVFRFTLTEERSPPTA